MAGCRPAVARAWLLVGMVLSGVEMAQGSEVISNNVPNNIPNNVPNIALNTTATGAQGNTRVSYALGFGAEWDAALHARDVPRVTALMRRANGQMPQDKHGETPLHQLPRLSQGDDAVPVMRALLASGADVHAATEHGYTALHMAAASPCLPCLQVLLRAGAQVRLVSRNGSTPLHISLPHSRAALVAAGADIAARDKLGRVPLHTVDMPSEDLLGSSSGMGVNVVDAQGFTPLHWAAFEGRHLAIEWLLAHGANTQLRSTAAYQHSDGILAAEWASTTTYPAGQRAYDLAKAQHDSTKWSSGKFRQAWELLDKATPRQGLFSR